MSRTDGVDEQDESLWMSSARAGRILEIICVCFAVCCGVMVAGVWFDEAIVNPIVASALLSIGMIVYAIGYSNARARRVRAASLITAVTISVLVCLGPFGGGGLTLYLCFGVLSHLILGLAHGKRAITVSVLAHIAALCAQSQWFIVERAPELTSHYIGVIIVLHICIAAFTVAYIAVHQHSFELVVSARAESLRAQQKAEDASQAKDAFLTNMSHELRTPLNAIIGYAEIIEEDAHEGEIDAPSLGEDARRISTSSRHLLRLINDVLDLAKIGAGKIRDDLRRGRDGRAARRRSSRSSRRSRASTPMSCPWCSIRAARSAS